MMAILDPRLLPLIETLAAEDADWLAFEVLEGVRLGKVTEESPNDLQNARDSANSAAGPGWHSEKRPLPPPASVPILGDEQIVWAADYVGKRITDAVTMLQAALDEMDAIVVGTVIHDRPAVASVGNGTRLVLQGDEEESSVSKDESAAAMNAVSRLQKALHAWANSAMDRGIPE
jgi:hypothetical protein